jgi:pimeloyl-ACP methyl ester carboxylesterase
MPRAALPTGIELEYVTAGDPSHPPLLVVNGYTTQLISWPQGYIDRLVDQDLFVIRFDNRDVGLSTKLDGQHVSPGRGAVRVVEGRTAPRGAVHPVGHGRRRRRAARPPRHRPRAHRGIIEIAGIGPGRSRR